MRETSLFVICIFLINTRSVIEAHVPSVDKTLRTNQYFLVKHQDSVTSIETEVPIGLCPHLMTRIASDSKNLRYSGAHLIRDTFGLAPPKLLTIRDSDAFFEVTIFTLNVSAVFQKNGRKFLSSGDVSEMSRSARILKEVRRSIKFTIFDSTSHNLYVDLSSADKFDIEQYYINVLHTPTLNYTFLGHHHKDSLNNRFDWQEDPYSEKVYYKEKIDGEIVIFEAPLAAFVPIILDGEAGKKIGTIKSASTLMGATGGVFYTFKENTIGNATKLSTSLVPSNMKAGLECVIKKNSSKVPKFHKLIIIRDYDYCLLRDGSKYDRKLCEEEQKEYYSSAFADEESTDIVKWLLAICITLFMVVILLFIYIYWLRSTFVSDYDRTHPNEYETEASLFVAKQKSFPSVYQDPALLDVSVDKWN